MWHAIDACRDSLMSEYFPFIKDSIAGILVMNINICWPSTTSRFDVLLSPRVKTSELLVVYENCYKGAFAKIHMEERYKLLCSKSWSVLEIITVQIVPSQDLANHFVFPCHFCDAVLHAEPTSEKLFGDLLPSFAVKLFM